MDELTSKLWKAAEKGDYHLAHQLIHRGANVNGEILRDENVGTLLHSAAAKGDVLFIRLLIKHNANCNTRDRDNHTPLHWVIMFCDRPDIIDDLIIGGAEVDARDIDELTPLHWAVRLEKNELAQRLIARGASTEAVDRRGWSVLHWSVYIGNLTMAKVLISHKVNIDAKNLAGFTPLIVHLATDGCKPEITQLLLDNGADVNIKLSSHGGASPLICAPFKACTTSIHLLLKRGARVNETSSAGYTALHNACRMERAEVVPLLLEFGADLNARSNDGKTPFELLPNSPSSEAIARIIIREIVKRETSGQPLSEGYQKMVQSCENYLKFDLECRDEIKRMRSEKIDVEHSTVSFFYIFTKDEQKLAALVRNESIVRAFEASDSLSSFRIYASDLTTKFEVAKVRANLLMRVEDDLFNVLSDILPVPILQKISAYSNECDDYY